MLSSREEKPEEDIEVDQRVWDGYEIVHNKKCDKIKEYFNLEPLFSVNHLV